eukprot:CAMPEP_0201871536 /NCGR_PEP_ID=MMETSP0902-20130614/4437_1 /ASSEMBLY_ACC=CAM_ASM_000551 /TAXON_ID=420261 /ORGANISM="Thalassiosira antarctica, Strain CCMP982" /LENGTH=114 /DNA_ID=CAMNT_0048397549 /DNA_START=30 /DNA_END=374 /DNA_ORIENTATION=-
MADIQHPYKCTVHLALPSNQYAQHLRDVISVDQEISNKVVKTFKVVRDAPADHDIIEDRVGGVEQEDGDGNDGDDMRILRIQFVATDAKMLRVSMSTTYDMINVALKCFQEFGE